MKALFLVNARSGARRRLGIEALIGGACAHLEHEIVACGRKEELDDIVERAARDGVDVVYAVGGDGTVHETAKRLIGRTLALGVVPTGPATASPGTSDCRWTCARRCNRAAAGASSRSTPRA